MAVACAATGVADVMALTPCSFRVLHHTGFARVRGGAVAAAGLVLAACASGGGHHEGTRPSLPASARASAAAVGGADTGGLGRHGELAFVGHGRLFLLGGPATAPRRVVLPGISFAPAWSADHRWLAVEVSEPPTPSMPYLQEPATLWLVNAAGTRARQLTPASWDITSFAWSPRAPRLVVAVHLGGAQPARSYVVATVTPTGRRVILAVGSYVSGVAWSPRGQQIAAGLATFPAPPRHASWQGRLELLNPAGGRPRAAATSAGNVLELAGWWPDGSGLLYWTDPGGSDSIAADGLPLASVSLVTGRSARLARSVLVHGSWVAFSPDGHTAAVVTGGDRTIWGGHKHIGICRSSGHCTAVAEAAGTVALQPSWSPDGGTVAFTRAPATGPFGPSGHADFSPYWLQRWQATSRVRLATPDGSGTRPLAAAGPGAVDPVWGRDGSMLFVRADWLWLLPAGAAAPTRLAGPLGTLASPAYAHSYYGYIPYPQLVAWTGARPLATAGNS
jgi:Tol biopolymer transport system component